MKKIIALLMALAFLVPAAPAIASDATTRPDLIGLEEEDVRTTDAILSTFANLKASPNSILVCRDMAWSLSKGTHCKAYQSRWLTPGKNTWNDFNWSGVEGFYIAPGCEVTIVGTFYRYYDRTNKTTGKWYNMGSMMAGTAYVNC